MKMQKMYRHKNEVCGIWQEKVGFNKWVYRSLLSDRNILKWFYNEAVYLINY